MRDDWTELPLGEICQFQPGKYLKKEIYAHGGAFTVYGANSVMGSHTEALFEGPLSIMAAVGAYAGAVQYSVDPCWVNNNAFAIIANTQALPAYLHYWLDVSLNLNAVRRGTGQPYVSKKVLAQQVVPIPPPREQRWIVEHSEAITESFGSYIKTLKQQLKATKAVRQSLLSDLLKSPDMAENWQQVTLGDIVDINPESVREWDDNQSIRYVEIGCIVPEKGINLAEVSEFALKDAPTSAQRVIRANDVLISNVRPNLRKLARVPSELNGEVATTGFTVLRAKQVALPAYIWAVVRATRFTEHLEARVTGSTYPTIKAMDVASYLFSLPPLEEQQRIVKLTESLTESFNTYTEALDQLLETARMVRQALLTDLLTPPERGGVR